MNSEDGREGDDMDLEEGDLEETLQLEEVRGDDKLYYSLQVDNAAAWNV